MHRKKPKRNIQLHPVPEDLSLSQQRQQQKQQAGKRAAGGGRGFSSSNQSASDKMLDQWSQDLDAELNNNNNNSSSPNNRSNPQGGSGGYTGRDGGGMRNSNNNNNINNHGESSSSSPNESKLKSPPESLAVNNNYFEEEKKNSSPAPTTNDTDEHDSIVPLSHNNNNPPMSALTTQSSLDGSDASSSEMRQQRQRQRRRTTVALVKLRVWDPANPQRRLRCLTSTRIALPSQSELDNAAAVQTNTAASTTGSMKNKEGIMQQQKKSDGSKRKKKQNRRLSMVKEEPDCPRGRGGSYYFDDGAEDNAFAKIQAFVRSEEKGRGNGDGESVESGGDDDEDDDEDDEGNDHAVNDDDEEGEIGGEGSYSRNALRVGTLVGIQQRSSTAINRNNTQSTTSANNNNMGSSTMTSSGMSTASSVASNAYSLRKNFDWKVGISINLHKVTMMSIASLSCLHYQIETNSSLLKELVMDGLPPNTLALQEAELLFEALGTNTSIKRLSMRYAHVDDDLGSLFALALVDNTSMTQLSLEGNHMTNVSAKNFYSVLKKNNETLRLLDLSENPMIDEDVTMALDQFMEQRSLKRTLTNKAEKAKRAARGLPVDSDLDQEADGGGGEGNDLVTVVCVQGVIDAIESGDVDSLRSSSRSKQQQQQQGQPRDQALPQDNIMDTSDTSNNKPYPGEKFSDYMLRMDQMKSEKSLSPEFNRRLMNESVGERDAFDTYSGSHGGTYLPNQHSHIPPAAPDSPVDGDYEGETIGSSITSRSTKKDGRDNHIITTSSNSVRGGSPTELKKSVQFADSAKAASALPPMRMYSAETLESADEDDNFTGQRRQAANRERNLSFKSVATEASDGPSTAVGAFAYHNTQATTGSNPSLDISETDYMDPKADEAAIRRSLAQSHGAVGAYHIHEAAPARQNRSAGSSGRRGRMGRSESARQRRLAELAGSTGANTNTTGGRSTLTGSGMDTLPNEEILSADIELAYDEDYDDYYRQERPRPHRRKSYVDQRLGLDEDAGTDKFICGIVAALALGFAILIVVLIISRT